MKTSQAQLSLEAEKWMTVEELAEYLQVHPRTVYRLIRKGLPHTRVGRPYRFKRSLIDEWLKRQGLNQQSSQ